MANNQKLTNMLQIIKCQSNVWQISKSPLIVLLQSDEAICSNLLKDIKVSLGPYLQK
jgi:hypothetical protein